MPFKRRLFELLQLLVLLLTPYFVFAIDVWGPDEVSRYERSKDRIVKVYGGTSGNQVVEVTKILGDGTQLRITTAFTNNNENIESVDVFEKINSSNSFHSMNEGSVIVYNDGTVYTDGSEINLNGEVGQYLSYKRFLLDQALNKVLVRAESDLEGAEEGGGSSLNLSSPGSASTRNPYYVGSDTRRMIDFYSSHLSRSDFMVSDLKRHRAKVERKALKRYVSDARRHHKRLMKSIKKAQISISRANNQVVALGEEIRAQELKSQLKEVRQRVRAGLSFYSGKISLNSGEKKRLIKETLKNIKFGLTDKGAALVSRLFAYVDASEIPEEVYNYVDRSGVLKGDYFQEGQLSPLGEGTEVENTLRVANDLQVVVSEFFSFEDMPIEQGKAFIALTVLNLANLEFGSGTSLGNERGYEYLKLAKSIVKDLGSFGGGFREEIYSEIRETLEAVVDIGSLSYQGFQALINDPQGVAELAEGVFSHLLENYQELGKRALIGTGKMIEAELERKDGQIQNPEGLGEVTGEVVILASTLGIGKLIKAGVMGTRATLGFIKKFVKKIPAKELEANIGEVKNYSEFAKEFSDSAKKTGLTDNKVANKVMQSFARYFKDESGHIKPSLIADILDGGSKAGWSMTKKVVDDLGQVVSSLKDSGKLPGNFITKEKAIKLGWIPKKGNLHEVAPGKSIGGNVWKNKNLKLPGGKIYYEADLGYNKSYRGKERLLWSDEGNIYITNDHYETFTEIIE